MVKIQRLILVLFLLVGFWPQLALAAQVQAVADRNQVALGESLHLELRVNGSPDGDPDLTPFDQDWEVLSRSQSSQIQIINGDFNRSVVYSLTLMPRKEGDVNIPAICFGSDCSAPLPIRVTAADQTPTGSDTAELLLETEATPQTLYSQEQLLFTVRLLRRVDLLQGSLTEPQPSGVDAVVQKLGDDRSYETRRAGRLYQVIERSYAIFPQTSGTLEIAPLRFEGEISRGASRFDPFGNRGQRIRKLTDAVKIEVLPPPGDRNGRSWLPAKTLDLQDDWQDKTLQLTVGEPATRTLTLTAAGLQAAQLPELHFAIPAEFKSYPDQPSRKDDTTASGISGVLQQKIALVPTQAGHYQLPAIDLDWWDVQTQQWQKAHLDPVQIDVSPAAGTPVVVPPAATQAPPQPAATPLPSAPAAPAEAPAPLLQAQPITQPGFWPWLSLGLGLGWLLTLILLWRQRSKRPRAGNDSNQEENSQPSEKAARQAVLQAARKNDPAATRQALTAWCRTLRPDSPAVDLERLGQTCPELKMELDRLNRALYSPQKENWTGQELSDVIRQWEQQRKQKAGEKLPDLYPTSTRSDRSP